VGALDGEVQDRGVLQQRVRRGGSRRDALARTVPATRLSDGARYRGRIPLSEGFDDAELLHRLLQGRSPIVEGTVTWLTQRSVMRGGPAHGPGRRRRHQPRALAPR